MVRQQLKWPVLAVVLFGAVYGGSTAVPRPGRRRVDPVRGLPGGDPDLGRDRRAPLPAVRDRPHHQPHRLVGGDHRRPGRRVRRRRARAPGRCWRRSPRRRRSPSRRPRSRPARSSSPSAGASSAPSTAGSIARASMPNARRRASRIGCAARSRSTRSRMTCRRRSTARCGRRPRACGCGSRGTVRRHRARNGHRTTVHDDAHP